MPSHLILGAGVTGLTTALELHARHPLSKITLAAQYLPGDTAPSYASAWGGANWFPASRDNGRQQDWDAITYSKFGELAAERPESGVEGMRIRFFYERAIREVGILGDGDGTEGGLWFGELVRGLERVEEKELPAGTVFGFEMASFVVNVQMYLPWLQAECARLGIEIHRRVFKHIDEALELYPEVDAVFNCTGLGALTLGGVEDQKMYPSRGQIILVEGPKEPIRKMAFRAPDRDGEATHVFPRGPNGRGGVILGGCRQKNNWNGEVDLEFAEVIKKRCCALVPQLGKPENLRVIKHGVGFRPGREGGARIEAEKINDRLVIHSYGAGGTGFQASWGMARYAVDLLPVQARL